MTPTLHQCIVLSTSLLAFMSYRAKRLHDCVITVKSVNPCYRSLIVIEMVPLESLALLPIQLPYQLWHSVAVLTQYG